MLISEMRATDHTEMWCYKFGNKKAWTGGNNKTHQKYIFLENNHFNDFMLFKIQFINNINYLKADGFKWFLPSDRSEVIIRGV